VAKTSITMYQSIAAAFWSLSNVISCSVRSVAHRLTALFGSTYLSEEAFSHMKINRSSYQSLPTDGHLKYYLHLCLSNYEPSFSDLPQVRQVLHQIRNRKVEEKQLLIMVNCFSLKLSIFNK